MGADSHAEAAYIRQQPESCSIRVTTLCHTSRIETPVLVQRVFGGGCWILSDKQNRRIVVETPTLRGALLGSFRYHDEFTL